MSSWTYINATIDVDFGKTTDFWIRQFFADMKDEKYTLFYDIKAKGRGFEITGSEQNAVVVAEPKRNYDTDFRNRYWHGQQWLISIAGSLRDRHFKETVAEWNRFLWKLAWFVRHDCQKLTMAYDDFDRSNGVFPEIEYYMVDIRGCWQGERYFRTSIDREFSQEKSK